MGINLFKSTNTVPLMGGDSWRAKTKQLKKKVKGSISLRCTSTVDVQGALLHCYLIFETVFLRARELFVMERISLTFVLNFYWCFLIVDS